ncbi:MAG: peptidase domain-containing ABC transporter [Flavobacteriales bacterium]|nr:peptidase domain-containing ABC transporter [Flavobacteriales bacterium]
MKQFPYYKQLDQMDCGPTCLKIVAKHYGRVYSLDYLRDICYINRIGVTISGIADGAEAIGLRTLAVKLPFEKLINEVPLPCIAYWNEKHFVVIYKVEKNKIYISDPAHGLIVYSKVDFLKSWSSENNEEGILLLLEKTPDFERSDVGLEKKKLGFRFLVHYLIPFKRYIIQLILGLVAASILQLVFPFLTQSIIDYGITNQNLGFITLILIAQLVLFISQTAFVVVRRWLLLHMGTRINIAIASDFLAKLMRLPVNFFEAKHAGDIMQRIHDNQRVENFLSTSTLSVMFSFFNLLIFSIVLAYYNFKILLIFLFGSTLYVIWTLFFMKKRKELDYLRFNQMGEDNQNVMELVYGMQEIKLNNSEKRRRWKWEDIRIRLFKISIKSLTLDQLQNTGGSFINELKNIIISFVAAYSVISGEITLGMMFAIQYIIGQLNSPISSFISFIQTAQDAKISIERLEEIHDKEDEDNLSEKINLLPENRSITLKQVGFRYGGPSSPLVLDDVNLNIPEGKVTAIVGVSGSGKTTLIKLLLKFYDPENGEINVGNIRLKHLNAQLWRSKCGVVMQDGFIFGDTIAQNIAESDSNGRINKEKLVQAAITANIEEFIEGLPNGYNTKVGSSGIALSGGQKQRLLIARAVYKNPEYLFFDEATSSLDANNEKIILENLQDFYKNKTVIVVAHRLSTVKNADQIVVLNKGKVVEIGTHLELTATKGYYYTLVKNQLELGK